MATASMGISASKCCRMVATIASGAIKITVTIIGFRFFLIACKQISFKMPPFCIRFYFMNKRTPSIPLFYRFSAEVNTSDTSSSSSNLSTKRSNCAFVHRSRLVRFAEPLLIQLVLMNNLLVLKHREPL